MHMSRIGVQMSLKTDLHGPDGGNTDAHRDQSSLNHSLPIPANNSSRFGSSLPALHDVRGYSSGPSSASHYDYSSQPSSASAAYSYAASWAPSYPTSAPATSSNINPFNMTTDQRPRIPPIQSPTAMHAQTSNSKAVSPGLGSSVRQSYVTSTPHLSRHINRGSDFPGSPHSPLAPSPRSISSPTLGGGLMSPMDHGANTMGGQPSGPPLQDTQQLVQLTSMDGSQVRPEIHARVDKGFFLADRDWTCYRRNYFSVVCSYSLSPAAYGSQVFLRRNANSNAEPVQGFAMCISAVVDAPGGKTVELVQHTPKRDKGPQHKPNKIKLSPQPAGGMGFPTSSSNGLLQPSVQNIAVFDRIQFKSATANNGKRRAAQQYYHLIVELYADMGQNSSTNAGGVTSAPSQDNWVKIAYRISAPMVVRGRSPGHYAEGRNTSSTSSPGGGGSGGGNGNGHPQSPANGGSGMMGGNVQQSNVMMDGPGSSMSLALQTSMGPITSHHTSPASASMHAASVGTPSTIGHVETPVDPLLEPDVQTYDDNLEGYQYLGGSTIYEGPQGSPHMSNHGCESPYGNERKSEHALETNCQQFDNNIPSYIPTSMAAGDSLRASIKEEQMQGGWLSAPVQGRDHQKFDLFRKCGSRYEPSETSRNYYPDLPAV